MQPSLSSNPENFEPRSWKKTLLWSGIGVVTIVASLGGYTMVQWFTSAEARTSLQFATTLQQQGNFQGCINQAKLVPSNSSLQRQAAEILQSCQLSQANTFAQQNNLTEAIKLLGNIPESPLNPAVQSALDDWSNMLVDRAAAQYDLGKREAAFDMLKTIPASSSAYQTAAEKRDQWNNEWITNAGHIQKIHQVLQVNDLKGAFAELQQITTLYWTQQAHDIILTKITDIIAYEQSVAAANAEKAAIAQQLQAEAERLLHEARVKAEKHYAESHAHPKPHHWHPDPHWFPVPWMPRWVPISIPYPHPPFFPPDHRPKHRPDTPETREDGLPPSNGTPLPDATVPPIDGIDPSDTTTAPDTIPDTIPPADGTLPPDTASPTDDPPPSDVVPSPDGTTSTDGSEAEGTTPSDPDLPEGIPDPDVVPPTEDIPSPDPEGIGSGTTDDFLPSEEPVPPEPIDPRLTDDFTAPSEEPVPPEPIDPGFTPPPEVTIAPEAVAPSSIDPPEIVTPEAPEVAIPAEAQ